MRSRNRALWETFRFGVASLGIPLTKNEADLRKHRNRYKGRRGFVIGNGPSLKKIDLDMLKNEVTIASNGIFLLYETTSFRPTYYTVEDTLVAEDRATEIFNLKDSIKVLPTDVKKWIPPDPNTVYINFLRHYPGFPRFSNRFTAYAFWGGTVSYLNLQLAHYIGLEEIYLVGFDHNYKPSKVEDEKTGSVILSNTADENHFDSRYFGPGYRWHDPMVSRMEQSYKIAKRFFDERGVPVYNATVGGHLEVFPRISFQEIFR